MLLQLVKLLQLSEHLLRLLDVECGQICGHAQVIDPVDAVEPGSVNQVQRVDPAQVAPILQSGVRGQQRPAAVLGGAQQLAKLDQVVPRPSVWTANSTTSRSSAAGPPARPRCWSPARRVRPRTRPSPSRSSCAPRRRPSWQLPHKSRRISRHSCGPFRAPPHRRCHYDLSCGRPRDWTGMPACWRLLASGDRVDPDSSRPTSSNGWLHSKGLSGSRGEAATGTFTPATSPWTETAVPFVPSSSMAVLWKRSPPRDVAPMPILQLPEPSDEAKVEVARALARVLARQILHELREGR